MGLPTLSQLHTGLTLALALGLGASVAELQRLQEREVTAKYALLEKTQSVTDLTKQLQDTRQRADDLERSSHVVTTVLKKPDGTVQETRTVDTRVSDKATETEQVSSAVAVHQEVQATKAVTSESTSKTSAAAYAATAWRNMGGWGGSAGARLGTSPAWLEAGWQRGAGWQLGLRLEF